MSVPILNGTSFGRFYSFDGFGRHEEHFVVALGAPDAKCPIVRVHSECVTGDVFHSQLCDCGSQLDEAVRLLDSEGGFLIYLRQEGRGIGLYAKLDAYALQAVGFDTYEANRRLNYPDDLRDFGCAADMLRALGVQRLRLITNNPNKVEQLVANGIDVEEVIPTGVFQSPYNARYLEAKKVKHHHTLNLRMTAGC